MAADRAPSVVFDVNVLLSAFVFRGRPYLCLRLAERGLASSLTSAELLDVFQDKLVARFGFDPRQAAAAASLVRCFSQCVSVHGHVSGACRDPDDDAVLDCAAEPHADHIVTGDKDLLALDPFRGWADGTEVIRIVPPVEFLSQLGSMT